MGKVIGVILILLFIGFIVFEIRGFIIDMKKRKALKEKNQNKDTSVEVEEVTISDFENSDTKSVSSDKVNK